MRMYEGADDPRWLHAQNEQLELCRYVFVFINRTAIITINKIAIITIDRIAIITMNRIAIIGGQQD